MLNDIDEIREWIYNYTNLEENDFEIDEKTLKVNAFKSLIISLFENEFLVDFQKVNGNFSININPIKYTLLEKEHLKTNYFPKIILGDLLLPNLPFEQSSFDDWNVEYIKGNINLCSSKTNLTNLNFLINTKFDGLFYLKVFDTPFKDDKIPKEFKNLCQKKNTISKEELDIIIQPKELILDYFDFNNIQLDKE